MRLRELCVPLKWVIVVGALGALCALAFWVHALVAKEREDEAGGDKVESPRRAKDGVVQLDEEMAERLGVEAEPARAVEWTGQVTLYGRVVANARATVEVRAALAGTLGA